MRYFIVFFGAISILYPTTGIAGNNSNEFSHDYPEIGITSNLASDVTSENELHILGVGPDAFQAGDQVCLSSKRGESEAYIEGFGIFDSLALPPESKWGGGEFVMPYVKPDDWNILFGSSHNALAVKGSCSDIFEKIDVKRGDFSILPEQIRLGLFEKARQIHLKKTRKFLNESSGRDPKEYILAKQALKGQVKLKFTPQAGIEVFDLGSSAIAYASFRIDPDVDGGLSWLGGYQEYQFLIYYEKGSDRFSTLDYHGQGTEGFLHVVSVAKLKTNEVMIVTSRSQPEDNLLGLYKLEKNKMVKINKNW